MSKNSDQPTTLLINSFYLSAKRNQILLRLNSKCQGTGTSSNLTLVPLKRNFLSTVDRWPRKATAKSRGLAETYIPNSPPPLFFVFLASSLLFRVPGHLLDFSVLLLIALLPDHLFFLLCPLLFPFCSLRTQRTRVKANSH